MSSLTYNLIDVTTEAGVSANASLVDALRLSADHKCPVRFTNNSVTFLIFPADSIEACWQRYEYERKRLS